MKKNINTKISSCILASVITLGLSFSVSAEDMKLEEAKAEITRLEEENTSLKQELDIYEKQIAKHKEKLEEHDRTIMEMKAEE
ncbi:MAG: hypothetical protein HND53_05875 [Proteobacteria bacterium]|nr:hypothetical protein [Pseudomonadota bacterium]NOG60011.1 hypothetical protein [Pseudomonadota bacterium]